MRRPAFDKTVRPDLTDLAIVVGPNVRHVECDVEDLLEFRPEVLLGYRVKMATTAGAMTGRLRGMIPAKVVVLESDYSWSELGAIDELVRSTWLHPVGKAEGWHVHRGTGIWRVW